MYADDIRRRISRDSVEKDTPTLINDSINSLVKISHIHFTFWHTYLEYFQVFLNITGIHITINCKKTLNSKFRASVTL